MKNTMTKDALRKLVRERRGQAAPSDIQKDSDTIFRKIYEFDDYITAGTVYAYMDFRNEVQTRRFIACAWADGKQVAVPKVCGEDLKFYYIDSFHQLEEGTMGILEPKKGLDEADSVDAPVIMPGIAFDTDCNRVGYGGGYYDRYLKAHPYHTTIAVAFEFQMFDKVPHDENDVRPLWLVTESRMIHRNKRQE